MTVVVGLTVAGCAPLDERSEFMRAAFIEDHLDLLRRDSTQVAAKWQRMSTDPFQFLRGAASLWARDALLPGGPANMPTAFAEAATLPVWLVFDPHPENIGTFRTDAGELTLEFNDFDAARIGPFHLDVRRLALGFAVAVADLSPGLADGCARAVAAGYRAGLATPSSLTRHNTPGLFVKSVFEKAKKKGDEQEELTTLTQLRDGERRLLRTNAPPTTGDAEWATDVDAAWAEPLREALRGYTQGLGIADVVDVVRMYGKGVGTRPHLRFVALLADDRLIEIKEVRDPIAVPDFVLPQARQFVDNAERVVEAERTLQSQPSDPLLGAIKIGNASFIVQSESGYFRSFRVKNIRELFGLKTASASDVVLLARTAGVLLGAAHARSLGAHAGTLADGIDSTLLEHETADFVAAYLPVALKDVERLRELLSTYGPELGFVP